MSCLMSALKAGEMGVIGLHGAATTSVCSDRRLGEEQDDDWSLDAVSGLLETTVPRTYRFDPARSCVEGRAKIP